jgi:hypothetical protein
MTVRHRFWLRIEGQPRRSKERVYTGWSCCGVRCMAEGGPGSPGAVTCKRCLRCRRCTTPEHRR